MLAIEHVATAELVPRLWSVYVNDRSARRWRSWLQGAGGTTNCDGSGVWAASHGDVILHCACRLKTNKDSFEKISYLHEAEQIDWLLTKWRPVCARQCPDRFGQNRQILWNPACSSWSLALLWEIYLYFLQTNAAVWCRRLRTALT